MSKTVIFQALALGDITALTFTQGPAGVWRCAASASVHDSGGANAYGATFSLGSLNGAQTTAIQTFVTNNILVPFNAQEGV